MPSTDAPTPLTYRILLALAGAPLHGYGIIKEIEASDGADAAPSTGALYLALQRMEADGLIEDSAPPAGELDADARRRYYRVTPEGMRVVRRESRRLAGLVDRARAKDLLGDTP